MNGIQEVSGSIPLISTKRLEILRFQASFFVFATIFNGFWIFIFPRFVHKCDSVIPTHRVQGIETNSFPCTRYLGLDVDFPLHLINRIHQLLTAPILPPLCIIDSKSGLCRMRKQIVIELTLCLLVIR